LGNYSTIAKNNNFLIYTRPPARYWNARVRYGAAGAAHSAPWHILRGWWVGLDNQKFYEI